MLCVGARYFGRSASADAERGNDLKRCLTVIVFEFFLSILATAYLITSGTGMNVSMKRMSAAAAMM